MAHLPPQYVKRGMWVNEEEGPIFGRVITAESGTGTLVVAILAVMTAFGTTHLWNLIMFSYHQMRVNSLPMDGLMRQQQATLRTLPTPSSLVCDWIKLWWAWRGRAKKPFLRSLPKLLLGIFFTVGTVTVSLSTSYVVSTSGIQVLVQSRLCGPMRTFQELVNSINNPAASEYYGYLGATAKSYMEDCYSHSNHDIVPDRCAAFIRPSVEFNQGRVQCPFGSICAKVDMPGISFDSGLLDLNDVFGLNLPQRDRVKYRRKTTCALLDAASRYSELNTTRYPQVSKGDFWELQIGKTNRTHFERTVALSKSKSNITTHFTLFAFMKYGAPVYSSLSTIDPVAEMVNAHADITLFVIAPNAVVYEKQINDPLFSAHRAVRLAQDNGDAVFYYADHPFSALGCEVQHQYCYAISAGQEHCTDMSYLPGQVSPEIYPGVSATQLSVLRALVRVSTTFDIELAATLKASSVFGEGYIPNLPDDQWIQEITNWESTTWAGMQIMLADMSIGIGARVPKAAGLQNASASAEEKRMCQMQRMKNPGGFVNISVFGLAFTLTFCCLVTAVDIILLKFLVFLKRFRTALAPRIDAWIQDGTYQLQRRAYEAHGKGDWERLDGEIPLTKGDEELDQLPLESLPDGFPVNTIHHHCSCETNKWELNSLSTSLTDQSPGLHEHPTQLEYIYRPTSKKDS